MTPSEAVIFRAQVLEAYRRYVRVSQHKVRDTWARGGAACEHQALASAALFIWRDDLLEAAAQAAISLPTPVTFSDNLRPSESGLYLFNKPISFDGCNRQVRAVGWFALTNAMTMFWVYIDTAGTTWRDIGPVAAYGSFALANGVQVIDAAVADKRIRTSDSDFDMRKGSDSVVRFMLSSWLWLSQKVMRAVPSQVDRTARKLADRLVMSRDVNVVMLRRSTDVERADGCAIGAEWTCQWLVRGHWRKQYYPSTGEHRPLWIEPYVKGPEDKPFRAPVETVFAVTR